MQAGPDVLPEAEGGEGTPPLLLLHPHCCSLGLPLATLRWKLGEEAEIQLAWVSRCKSEQGKGVEGAQEKGQGPAGKVLPFCYRASVLSLPRRVGHSSTGKAAT